MSRTRSAKNVCADISDIDIHLSSILVCVLFWSCLSAGVDPSLQIDNRIQSSSQAVLPGSKHNKSRAANTRDERFRSGNHVSILPKSFKVLCSSYMLLLICVDVFS